MERNRTIDAFRGIAIVGMVFFSLTLILSKNLPELLRHNAPGMAHLGDLVLPMFLFASGLSLAYFIEKVDKLKDEDYYSKIFGRFALLAMVGIGLSYISASGFLNMDEVMLVAILFIICLLLYKIKWQIAMVLVLIINLSYLILIYYGWDEVFLRYYLGGYPAAIYYLPVMLTGLFIGKGIISDKLWSRDNLSIVGLVMIYFIITLFLYPIDKMAATPAFMMLSIVFSLLVFTVVNMVMRKVKTIASLEYLGKKPLRYWVLMFLFFMIPVRLLHKFYGIPIPFEIDWILGILIALGFLVFLAVLSLLFDKYAPDWLKIDNFFQKIGSNNDK